jgi:uncharacterized protein
VKIISDSAAERFALEIIGHFYPEDTPFRQMLLKHSYQVCTKAESIMELPEAGSTGLNRELVIRGALLHDIGIGRCHAPDILCMGTEPYIAHGVIGAQMLRNFGTETGMDLEAYARICERHTGTGLTAEDIRRQHLPLPERDFLPETPEEKLICLADKFYSKSGNMEEKSLSRIVRSMEKFGPETQKRWQELCGLFGIR